jgi:hypothetical protein
VLNLVDDEQLDLDRGEQAQHFILQLSRGLRGPKRGEDLPQDLRIESPLFGDGRRLDSNHRDARSHFAAVALLRRVLTHKSAEYCRLPVVGFADDEQIGHPVRLGQEQQLLELGRDPIGERVANPTTATDLGDPFLARHGCSISNGVISSAR